MSNNAASFTNVGIGTQQRRLTCTTNMASSSRRRKGKQVRLIFENLTPYSTAARVHMLKYKFNHMGGTYRLPGKTPPLLGGVHA
jgi:hypothetical protein